ncbi:hypothetical protein BDV27DRAFT_125317 [Aspergillus caelatus]|uniref:Uncharacterized protein n=1 Tax=Aspergillus caelatus TaxID=61420 RepID=A0A5N7ACW0_9EURO|nr:uncharacterized protein BDV27DRAFT_125317 [Aspergillus caelatus]KAE8366460.1 hypothetical protein BDV27DRAFT_125317 [Aspergillus caelatus]
MIHHWHHFDAKKPCNQGSWQGTIQAIIMLQLRRNCEYCDKDLPPSSREVRICCCECTFCADCAETKLANVCPNCGGNFAPRPIRPSKEWRTSLCRAKQPPSDKRVHLKCSIEDAASPTAKVSKYSLSLSYQQIKRNSIVSFR